MNQKYLYDENNLSSQYNYDIFKQYETIIIKSTTGTGKTTTTAKYIKQYLDEFNNNGKEYKILSIITRVSLANQLKVFLPSP